MSVEMYRESPGKFDSMTLNRTTLSRWTGRSYTAAEERGDLLREAGAAKHLEARVRAAPMRIVNVHIYIYIYIYLYIIPTLD